jgi:hypothetical protein
LGSDPVKDASLAVPVVSLVELVAVDCKVIGAVVGITVLVMIGEMFSMVVFSSLFRNLSSSTWVGSGVKGVGSRVVGTGVTTIVGLLVVDVVVDSRLPILRLVLIKLVSGALVVIRLFVGVSVGFI